MNVACWVPPLSRLACAAAATSACTATLPPIVLPRAPRCDSLGCLSYFSQPPQRWTSLPVLPGLQRCHRLGLLAYPQPWPRLFSPTLASYSPRRCGHCKNLKPEWTRAAQALKGILTVAAVDADAHRELGQEVRSRSISIFGFQVCPQ